jgi:hypothetical protein
VLQYDKRAGAIDRVVDPLSTIAWRMALWASEIEPKQNRAAVKGETGDFRRRKLSA